MASLLPGHVVHVESRIENSSSISFGPRGSSRISVRLVKILVTQAQNELSDHLTERAMETACHANLV